MITAPDQAWLDRLTRDGVAAFVTPAVSYHSERCNWTPSTEGDCRCKGRIGPDIRWEAMTGPCETCGGSAVVVSPHPTTTDDPKDRYAVQCPSCHGDGRKRVEVVKACETCKGSGLGRILQEGSWYGGPVPKCWDCTNGTVDTGLVVTVEVVPIIDADQPVPPGYSNNERQVWVSTMTEACWMDGGEWKDRWTNDLDLGPDPAQHIGKFAVVCTLDREAS